MEPQAKRLLVIGGGAAGMSAAAAARRRQPDAEIVVIERGPRVSFMLCGLPYFISDVVKDEESLVVYEADYFRTERQIDVRTGCEVKGIHAQEHTVECIDVATRERDVLGYKKLVIAAGAQPILPGIRGLELRGVFALRTLDSAIAIKQFIARRPVKRAAIIGAGYIGLEMAEALTTAGAATTMIEASDTVLPMSEPEIGELIEEELRSHSVELLKPRLALAFEGASATVERVTTDAGDVPAEMVLIAAGARPDSAVAREAGVALGEIGGIATDDMMRTSVPDIYAAGDCVESRNVLTGKTIVLPLGTTAGPCGRRQRHGRPHHLPGHNDHPRLQSLRPGGRTHRPLARPGAVFRVHARERGHPLPLALAFLPPCRDADRQAHRRRAYRPAAGRADGGPRHRRQTDRRRRGGAACEDDRFGPHAARPDARAAVRQRMGGNPARGAGDCPPQGPTGFHPFDASCKIAL
jgi:NADPH-dependent 2,4-dienoyl-CoA reductase/sulfur reductase-like enzyme